MEENFVKAISYAAVIVTLIVAISLFFVLYESCEDILSFVNKALTDKGVVYQAEEICEEKTVTGAEIIGSMLNGLKTGIFIDSVFVSEAVDADSFNYSLIDISSLYTVEYIFSSLGETKFIKYYKR